MSYIPPTGHLANFELEEFIIIEEAKTDSFVIDHATQGELDSAVYKLDGGYNVLEGENYYRTGDAIDFNFSPGVLVNIKIGDVFVEKPMLIKKAGEFVAVSESKVGGWA